MQMKIAVCDDERAVSSLVEELVMKIAEELSIQCDVDVYDSGEVLCHELDKEEYDLIFLDIELPKMNGIEIGKYIREVQRNEIVQIAYISAKEQYAMELFDYRPINFWVKSITEEQIRKVVKKYKEVTKQSEMKFTYKRGRDFINIPLSKILYFSSSLRKVTVTYIDESEGGKRNNYKQDTFYDSLENIYSSIKGNRFYFIHKSIIINYNYVSRMGYDTVVMVDGSIFSISQSRRALIRNQYMEQMRKTYNE